MSEELKPQAQAVAVVSTAESAYLDEIKKIDKDLNITIGMKVLKNKLSLIEWGD